MPIYRYLCECGKQYDEFRKIDSRNDPLECLCGKFAELRIMPTNVQADNTNYISAAVDKETGKHVSIRSRRQHREFLARNDYVEVGNDFTPPKRDDAPAPFNSNNGADLAAMKTLGIEDMKKLGFVEESF